MFLLVPAYPGCPGSKAVKRSLLLLFRSLCAMKYVLDYGRWAVEVCVFRRSSRQLLGVAGGRPV